MAQLLEGLGLRERMAVTPPRAGQPPALHALGLFPPGGAAGAPLVFAEPSPEPSPAGQGSHGPVLESAAAAQLPSGGSVGAPVIGPGTALVDELHGAKDVRVAPAAEDAKGIKADGSSKQQADDGAVLKPASAAHSETDLEAAHGVAGSDGGFPSAHQADAAGSVGGHAGGHAPAAAGPGCDAGSPVGERWAPKPATPLGDAETLPPALVRDQATIHLCLWRSAWPVCIQPSVLCTQGGWGTSAGSCRQLHSMRWQHAGTYGIPVSLV